MGVLQTRCWPQQALQAMERQVVAEVQSESMGGGKGVRELMLKVLTVDKTSF